VSSGFDHSMALLADSTVWAWGSNDYGELGLGDTSPRLEPVQVPTLTNVVSISAGFDISYALDANGIVWAWGKNLAGELGDGTYTDRWEPVQVHNLTDIVAIDAGSHLGIALDTGGNVYTWGWNYMGGIGSGDSLTVNYPEPFQTELTTCSAVSCTWHVLVLGGELGIEEFGGTSSSGNLILTAYPNPGFGVISFMYSGTTSNNAVDIQIMDITGRVVETVDVEDWQPEETLRWNTGENPPGIYFAKLYSGGNTVIRRIILLN